MTDEPSDPLPLSHTRPSPVVTIRPPVSSTDCVETVAPSVVRPVSNTAPRTEPPSLSCATLKAVDQDDVLVAVRLSVARHDLGAAELSGESRRAER